jgi:hypothetical protein
LIPLLHKSRGLHDEGIHKSIKAFCPLPFLANVSHKLALPPQLDDYWDSDRFGSIVSSTTYFQAHLLGQLNCCLLLGLDEVDWLFKAPKIPQGFFALLLSLARRSQQSGTLAATAAAGVYSTEVYIPLNINQSPFNVGLPIRLPELTFLLC